MADTRRRGAALERAILDAAVAELREGGYAGLGMDRVAKRAGTNKNALYRRWPSRAALGLAAYRELARQDVVLPDTGELRADVLALLRLANQTFASPFGEILRGLLADLDAEPGLREQLREASGDAGAAMWQTVLARAVHRGELAATPHPRVATVAVALLRNEFVLRGEPHVPDGVLVEIVDEVYLPLLRAAR
ncbi:AcrR family transcriptional regulator [Crossiella equi]|uniref:AcrR family transcriptional regulator n=1 Tax=Crossiella equi TaxID=130796 RepID=A0ABS5AA10_9PSEU|nr:TetR/AcrR family transcriptional regulator [Crossiella equi]MBP2473416.1 AcrR family transcriptional regulator [Crossiella equi]